MVQSASGSIDAESKNCVNESEHEAKAQVGSKVVLVEESCSTHGQTGVGCLEDDQEELGTSLSRFHPDGRSPPDGWKEKLLDGQLVWVAPSGNLMGFWLTS
jgi:hypothetical protein